MYPCPIRMRAQSFQNFSRKAILKLKDQLSQHDRCTKLNQRHLRYARRFKSTNQRITTKQTSLCGVGLWFWTANGRDTLIGGWLLPALSPSLVLAAEVKYSSRKIALKTAQDGEKTMTHGSVNIFLKRLLKNLLWILHFGTNYSHRIVHMYFFYK